MKITVLTNDTTHHRYFVQQLNNSENELLIISERSPVIESSLHDLHINYHQYEQDKWFKGKETKLDDFGNTFFCDNVNEDLVFNAIQDFSPDLIIVFGTGLIGFKLINQFQDRIFNLHGGNPEKYRGLDSHLWISYFKDWNYLVTTLHRVEPEFDTGEIVEMLPLPIPANAKLHQLRSINTEICIRLIQNLITASQDNNLFCEPQKEKGQYFSSIPEEYKQKCVENFETYTLAITNDS